MKTITGLLILVLFFMSIYWAISTPAMIPTLAIGWIIIWLQAKYNCFN